MAKVRGVAVGALLAALIAAVAAAAAAPSDKAGVRGGTTRPPMVGERSFRLDLAKSAPAVEVAAPEVTIGIAGFEGAATTDDGRIQVMVELEDVPAVVAYAAAVGGADPRDMSVRAAAASATGAQVARIRSAQARVAAVITGATIGARELYRVQKVLNGIAVAVAPERIAALRVLPGVKRVLPILAEYPTNSTSVPFIGAPDVWNGVSMPAGADGTGVRIGVIDTGIDYMHPNFGGAGALLSDYQGESADTTNFTTSGTGSFGPFPTAKVAGGTDLCGDAYTGSNATVPDPNPMDCNGHGSHVAGSAAGFGMTALNTTFTGPYDTNPATYSALAIGPGVAPQAQLYGIRVFGCTGSTGLTTAGIEWTLDPNGDNDLSDHLDVINLSLGSNFGSAVSSSSVAADNAALANIIVVTSAGNAGDTFFISGTPGAGSRVIATAASVDSGQSAVSVLVNSPVSVAGSYLGGAAAFGPAPSGQTANAVIGIDPADGAGALTTDACSPLTNGAAMAGNICVVDRGTCSFIVKVKNCQDAGAIGAIVVDNAPGFPPPAMGGTDPTITIPAERMTLADGTSLKNTINTTPPVNVTLLGQNGADTVASFSSRGPRRTYGSPLRLKPDIAAPGSNITSVQTGHVCATSTGCTGVADPTQLQVTNRALTISGTSMACPHMAGTMALLRQLHPTWSVEELKALAMNYALHDTTLFPLGTPPTFGPGRVGAGRTDPARSASGQVIAMAADDTGAVSVTFDPEMPLAGPLTQTRKVRVVNHGTASQTYDLGIATTVDSPGVAYSVPATVTVPAGQSVEFDVQLTVTPAAMDHTRDGTIFPTQGVQSTYGDRPRHHLTEEGAYITFSQSSTLRFRLPVYAAERPAASMSAADTITTGGAGTGSTTIALSGTHLCSGTLAAGPTCNGTFPTDNVSLVSPFELQVVSPYDPTATGSTDYADIQYGGVAFLPGTGSPSLTADLIMFGVSSWGDWSTPSEVSYNICIDNNQDGTYDKVIFHSNPSIFVAGATFNDDFERMVATPPSSCCSILGTGSLVNLLPATSVDSAMHLNNVMVLGATPSLMGFTSTTDTDFWYKVVTCPGTGNYRCAMTSTGDRCSPAAGTYFDMTGRYYYNWGAQGLNFGGSFLDEDLNGSSLPVSWNTANMTANGSLGAILLHHHNGQGKRAEVVLLEGAQRADLGVGVAASSTSPALNSQVTYTITVTNYGPDAASSVKVSANAYAGLIYVSDDGGGSFNSSSGIWTVGALANGGSATLHVVVQLITPVEVDLVAQVADGTPLDPNPANNVAHALINAPDVADLTLAMTVSSPTALPSQSLTYTLTLVNNGDGTGATKPAPGFNSKGDGTAYSINVNEAFSGFPVLDPTSYLASDGVYSPSTGVWRLASLRKGTPATLQLTLPAPNMIGNLTDQASASASTTDPATGDNAAQATAFISSPADVTGTKIISAPASTNNAFPGTPVTYTVVLNNNSQYDQFDNPGDEFVDTLPAQLTLIGASATSGAATTGGNVVHWNGAIPGYGSVTITITAVLNAGTEGQTVANQGQILYDADGNGSNESTRSTDDPAVGGPQDATAFDVAMPIPMLSKVGLAALLLLVAALGLAVLGRRLVS